MLSIGWSELLIIAAVALIVVGPKDLPVMLRNLGRALSVVRKMGNDFRRELDQIAMTDELKELKNVQKTVADPVRAIARDITKDFNKLDGGKTVPTGKLKPAEPGAQSVHKEIRAAAGMSPETPPPAVQKRELAAEGPVAASGPAPAEPAANTDRG